jgi:hypothetical protein
MTNAWTFVGNPKALKARGNWPAGTQRRRKKQKARQHGRAFLF